MNDVQDDLFFTKSVTNTDFASPLSGPVFRFQRDVRVTSDAPGSKTTADPAGEWVAMANTDWVLDQRFGARNRSYVSHIEKTISMPITVEANGIWATEIEHVRSFLVLSASLLTLILSFALYVRLPLRNYEEAGAR